MKTQTWKERINELIDSCDGEQEEEEEEALDENLKYAEEIMESALNTCQNEQMTGCYYYFGNNHTYEEIEKALQEYLDIKNLSDNVYFNTGWDHNDGCYVYIEFTR